MTSVRQPSAKRRKFCALCGLPPSAKNKEHILPKWLLSMTGDPNRTVWLGYDHKKKADRIFSYSSLTVPACTECNQRFSTLESSMKGIIESVLREQPLGRADALLILDWLDKVRTGMWTLYYMLDDNMTGIDPLFAIEQRMGLKDRMVIITKTSNLVEDLIYRGCNMPSFYYTPSVFSLTINNYAFTNISSSYFLAKDLGLPYPSKVMVDNEGRLHCNLEPGSNILKSPSFARNFPLPCTRICQPIWKEIAGQAVRKMYDTDYARKMSLDKSIGVGVPFIETESTLMPYPVEPTLAWRPRMGPDTTVSGYLLSRTVLEMQTAIDDHAPDLSMLGEEDRAQFEEILRTNKAFNTRTLAEVSTRWANSLLRE